MKLNHFKKFVLPAINLFFIFCLIPISAKTKAAPENGLKTGSEVIISGTIRSGIYLSRVKNSSKEYMNKSYNIYTANPIDVKDDSANGKTYRDIINVEIINPEQFGIHMKNGREITVRGILGVFNTNKGNFRQYSTPIYLKIIEIID